MKQFLEIGKIVNVHGIHGDVKVTPWCDDVALLCEFDILYLGNEYIPISVTHASVQKNCALLHLKGIDTADAAEKLRGKILYIDRDDLILDESTYFIADLIGLSVEDADNNVVYGQLTDVLQTGANDVYEITSSTGKKLYIPAIPDVIIETNLEAKQMKIRPLEGLFDAN